MLDLLLVAPSTSCRQVACATRSHVITQAHGPCFSLATQVTIFTLFKRLDAAHNSFLAGLHMHVSSGLVG